MRSWLLTALTAALAGCNGIAIGGSEGDESPCPNLDRPIDDPSVPAPGFDRPPMELLAAASGRFEGTLKVRGGDAVPVTVAMRVLPESLHAAAPEPNAPPACQDYVWGDVELDIDAGPQLSGQVKAYTDSREPHQIRGNGTPFPQLMTRFVPEFRAEVLNGPWLQVYLQFDAGKATWRGDVQALAHVRSEPCDETTEMCTGTPGGFDPQDVPLAELTARRVD